MTGIATPDQQRADLGFEEFDLCRLENLWLQDVDIGGR